MWSTCGLLRNKVSVKWKLQHPPPDNSLGIWLFWELLFKFPPTRAKMPFKCPTLGSIQVIKCPHPGDKTLVQSSWNSCSLAQIGELAHRLLQGHWMLSFSSRVMQHTKHSKNKSHLLRLLHSIHAIFMTISLTRIIARLISKHTCGRLK